MIELFLILFHQLQTPNTKQNSPWVVTGEVMALNLDQISNAFFHISNMLRWNQLFPLHSVLRLENYVIFKLIFNRNWEGQENQPHYDHKESFIYIYYHDILLKLFVF